MEAKKASRELKMPFLGTKTIAGGFVAAGGPFAGRGATVVAAGAGVYNITTDQQIDPTQKIINVLPLDAAGVIANVTADADAVFQVTTFTLPAGLAAGPVAADHDFYFEVKAIDLI